jgi:GH3 auxin-responsive promoter
VTMLDATPLLRVYARRRCAGLAVLDACQAQEGELLRLVRHAAATRFGRDHGFEAIRGVADFQRQVPLRRYEDFWRDYWQAAFPRLIDVSWPGVIPYFALSSGTTTGETKHIPVSPAMNASNRRAALDLLVFHVAARPASRILAGKNFMLGGSTDLVELAPGIRTGDLSGIAANEVPFWARPRYFPSRRDALLVNWEAKIDRLARLSLDEDIRSIGGTPSWLLLFFAKLAELRPDLPRHLASYYPNLQLLIHGAVNFAPYEQQFRELLAGSRAELREVYAASEGFIAAADCGSGEGLRLMVDNGLFYEFVPLGEIDAARPSRHWLAGIEPGVNYAVVLSSCAGLWAYVLGDTVKFVTRDPPRLLITGRLSYTLSAFGEHLIAEEIETAVAEAAAAVGSLVTDYSVGPLYPANPQARGRHLFVVEFAAGWPTSGIEAFAGVLDAALSRLNADYRAHRAGMDPPRVLVVKPGFFAAWMKSRGKIGGQHKVPRVINDQTLLDGLQDFLRLAG